MRVALGVTKRNTLRNMAENDGRTRHVALGDPCAGPTRPVRDCRDCVRCPGPPDRPYSQIPGPRRRASAGYGVMGASAPAPPDPSGTGTSSSPGEGATDVVLCW